MQMVSSVAIIKGMNRELARLQPDSDWSPKKAKMSCLGGPDTSVHMFERRIKPYPDDINPSQVDA
ncbi:hypothetical protein C8J57DRAFT_1502005 [Mycena rebaudengoi]|nr:hypothetical protein C8J57DRAFT_1502005 [Mycena rebaudengoi]